jgi:ADP-ribose pyrophosphatase YjhB (NUDIX family)
LGYSFRAYRNRRNSFEAAIREVKEETNLDISIKKLIGVYSDPNSQVFEYPNGKVVHFITTCFLAEITGGELKCNSDESLEIKFLNSITYLKTPY